MADIIQTKKTVPPAGRTNPDAEIDLTGAQNEGRDFLQDNQKAIIGVVGLLVLLAIAYFLYQKFYQEPRQAAAVEQLWKAQQRFEQDSFALALTNPGGGFPGFLDIIEDYGSTPAGNTASYYAGISYLHLGKSDAAVEYLEDFSPEGDLLATTKAGALGDAKAQLGDLAAAKSHYEDAIEEAGENDFLAPYYLKKLGMLLESEGNTADARKQFERIKTEFPTTPDAEEIDKYILRTEQEAAPAGN